MRLTHNQGIGDKGAIALAHWILQLERNITTTTTSCGCLQHLDLSYTSIGNVGVKALFDALQVHTCCDTSLYLNGNHTIDKVGAQAIGASLPLLKGLTHLKLLVSGSNQAEFLRPLVTGMYWNSSVTRLDHYRVCDDSQDVEAYRLQEQLQYYVGPYHKRILEQRQKEEGPEAGLWQIVLQGAVQRCGPAAAASVIYQYLIGNPALLVGKAPSSIQATRTNPRRKRHAFSGSHCRASSTEVLLQPKTSTTGRRKRHAFPARQRSEVPSLSS